MSGLLCAALICCRQGLKHSPVNEPVAISLKWPIKRILSGRVYLTQPESKQWLIHRPGVSLKSFCFSYILELFFTWRSQFSVVWINWFRVRHSFEIKWLLICGGIGFIWKIYCNDFNTVGCNKYVFFFFLPTLNNQGVKIHLFWIQELHDREVVHNMHYCMICSNTHFQFNFHR